jgi:hypothetical protein
MFNLKMLPLQYLFFKFLYYWPLLKRFGTIYTNDGVTNLRSLKIHTNNHSKARSLPRGGAPERRSALPALDANI